MCYYHLIFSFSAIINIIFKEVSEMKDFRLHLIVLILIVVAEKIGNISITVAAAHDVRVADGRSDSAPVYENLL